MTKIDDAMVERAAKAAYEADGRKSGDWESAWEGSREAWRKFIRPALEAALSPEPEIPVSEGMRQAGWKRLYDARGYLWPPEAGPRDLYEMQVVYQAMESARRKEAGEAIAVITTFANYTHRHRRSTDTQGPAAVCYGHRRKDDPK